MKISGLKYLILLSTCFVMSCNKSKLTEAESSINQKLLSVCETPWGQIVAEGAKAIAYEKDYAKCSEDCTSIEFQCTAGKLISTKINDAPITDPTKLVDIKNTKSNCTKETLCSCNLPDGKGIVSNGVQIQVYTTSQVVCDDTCDTKKTNVLCKNGVFVDPNTQAAVSNVNFSCTAAACKSCTAPWDTALKAAHKGSLTGYISSSFQCGGTCLNAATNSIKFNCLDGVLSRDAGALANLATGLKSLCSVNTNCNCKTADNITYTHDANTVLKLTLKAAGTCAVPCDAAVDYKCANGSFVKSSDGSTITANLFKTCTDQCIYCQLPNGTKIQQGATAVLNKRETGTCAQACESMTVRCDVVGGVGQLVKTSAAGVLADLAQYSSPKACSETCAYCNLPDNTKLQEGQTKDLASNASANCYTTCNIGTVTCDKIANTTTGTLRLTAGTGTVADYKYMSCTRSCVQCDMPNGTKLNNGEVSGPVYRTSSVKCGENCGFIRLYCTGGKLQFFDQNAPGNISEYTQSSCSPEVCKNCAAPWDVNTTIANGATGTRFTTSSPACGQTCDSTKIQYKCTDSILTMTSGPASGDLSTSKLSCSNPTCPNCNFNGKVYTQGATAQAYKNDGSSCALGVCSDYKTIRCDNGAMVGADLGIYKFGACQSSCVQNPNKTEVGRVGDASAEGGGANPWFCPILHGRGFAWGGTKLSYYTKSSVACNDSCSKYRITVECDNLSGIFTNSAQMLYTQCVEKCP